MRTIKFRAWDKDNFGMVYSDAGEDDIMWYLDKSGIYYEELDNEFGNNRPEQIIMQFTGLQDKNGKDIYEGDILQNNLEESIVSVIWEETGARWSFDEHCTFDDGVGRGNWDLNMGYAKNSEVIGNIYENKELLTRS